MGIAPIILASSPPPELDGLPGAFAVVAHEGDPAPPGMPSVPIAALLADRVRWCEGAYTTMIVMGLSRMLTPSNRVRLGQVLLRPRPHLRRVCVDRQLWVVDPWRCWWPFYAVGRESWGLSDSYLAESRWKRARENGEPDPFRAEVVVAAMAGVARVVDPVRFDPPIAVDVIEASAHIHAEYAALKEQLFTHERSLDRIIRELSAFAQRQVPQRIVPSPAQLFRRPPARIVCTDLRVDTWLTGELTARMALTNAIAEASGC